MPTPDQFKRYLKELDSLAEKNRKRELTPAGGIDFTSNDFLGLSRSPDIREAVVDAACRGVPMGSGGSRLLRGNHPEHVELEYKAAALFRCGKALYFANGFSANFALLTTLPKRHDLIVFDELSHASIRAGISSSLAKSVKVPHNDIDAIERVLSKWCSTSLNQAAAWIVVESLYSMDGDFAPLSDLLQVAERYGAMLIVDEAHATGVWGQTGHGLTECCEGHDQLIAVHTCGKALGAAGGLVCGPEVLIDYMVNSSRSFIYSTAPPPTNAVAVSAALNLIETEARRRSLLHQLIALANQKLESLFAMKGSGSQILPFIVGDDKQAVRVAGAMQDAGFDVRAIRPPTVPEGTARLRISITLNVTELEISNFFNTLHEVVESISPNRP